MGIKADYTNKHGLFKADCYHRIDMVITDTANGNASIQVGVYPSEEEAKDKDGNPIPDKRIDIVVNPVEKAEIKALRNESTEDTYNRLKAIDNSLAKGVKVGD